MKDPIPPSHPLHTFIEPVTWVFGAGGDFNSVSCSACAAKIASDNWAAKQQHEEFHTGLAAMARMLWDVTR